MSVLRALALLVALAAAYAASVAVVILGCAVTTSYGPPLWPLFGPHIYAAAGALR